MLRRTWFAAAVMSWPPIAALPEDGSINVVKMVTIVVFPAPLCPNKPKISPAGTERLNSFSAWVAPYLFVNAVVDIAIAVMELETTRHRLREC